MRLTIVILNWHTQLTSHTPLTYSYSIDILNSHTQLTHTQLSMRHRSIEHDCFHWKCYLPRTHQIEKPRFLVITWYKFTMKFWLNLKVYQGIWVSRFGGFRGCSIFSGICHSELTFGYCYLQRLYSKVAVCCSVLQCVALCCSAFYHNSFIYVTQCRGRGGIFFKSRFATKSTIAKCTTALTFERVYLQYLYSVERVEVQGGENPWDALSHTSLPAN